MQQHPWRTCYKVFKNLELQSLKASKPQLIVTLPTCLPCSKAVGFEKLPGYLTHSRELVTLSHVRLLALGLSGVQ